MFIQLNGQDYEVPTHVVLGSGIVFNTEAEGLEPFHAELRFRKNDFEIRGTGHLVSINGSPVVPGKWLKVNPSDEISLAGVPLRILPSRTPGMKDIHSIHPTVSRTEYKTLVPKFLLGGAFVYWGLCDMPRADLLFTLSILGIGCVVGLICTFSQKRPAFSNGLFSEHGLALYHRGKRVTESGYAGVEWQQARKMFFLVVNERFYLVKSPADEKFEATLNNRARPYVVRPVPYLAPALAGLLILLFFV